MMAFSLSTPHYYAYHQTTKLTPKRHCGSTTPVSFSIKPSPPTPPQPPQPRRPNPLKSSSSSSKPPPGDKKPPSKSNPLKNLVSPTHITATPLPPSTSSANSQSLSSKLRLSSKLNPPPPPPPPQIHESRQTQENQIPEKVAQQSERQDPTTEFRQEGKIFIGNLPNWIKKPEVAEFFGQFGPIKSVIVIKGHNELERNAGFGFVIYDGVGAEKAAMKAVEFDGVEFHGRVLTVKLDDGRRIKAKAEERVRWVEGEDGEEWRSKWHEERDKARNAFKRVLDTQPENWQAVVTAFERIKKVEMV